MADVIARSALAAVREPPHPTGLPKAEVEAVAQRFADKVGYRAGEALEPIVEKIGGRIEICDLDTLTNQTGSLDVRARSDFTIFLPPYTSRLRDRFTIAHELGHYVLHSRVGNKPIQVSRAESNEVEWEANWFAAAFLMPADEFRSLFDETSSIPSLAARFGVSPAAAEVRARALGLVSPASPD